MILTFVIELYRAVLFFSPVSSINGDNGVCHICQSSCMVYKLSFHFFQFLHDKISVLDLSECTISDVGLGHISKCFNLRKIDINSAKESRTEISSEGISLRLELLW